MFDTRWRKTFRDAWGHRARTLLVVLAVALGLIGGGTVLNAWALVRTTTQASYAASQPVAATLKLEPLDAGFLERVRKMPGIGAVRARRTVVATLQTGSERKTAVLRALDDVTRPDIGRLQDASGAWPPHDGEIMIEHSSLGYSGAVNGQQLVLAAAGKEPVSLTVGGLVRDVSVAPGWMDHLVYGYVSLTTLSRLGVPPAFDELQFTVSDPVPSRESVRQLAWRVKALAEAEGRRVGRIDVPVPGQHIHAAQIESLTLVQGVFGVLTLMVCGCLIVNLMSAMLAGQRRELGIMKAIGASERQLAAHILALAAGLGVLAVAVALPVAAWLGRLYGSFQGELLNFPVDRYAIPAWSPMLQAAIGIGLPVLSAAWPVAKACRQPVAEALGETGLPASTSGNRARRWLQGLPLARPQLLSLHNAFRQRLRFCLSLLALAVAGAVFVGAGNLRVAVKHSVDLLFDAQRYDVSLRVTFPMPAHDLVAAAAAVPGVAVAEAWGGASAALADHDGTVGSAFSLLAVPVHSRVLVPMLRSGRWLRDDEPDNVVIGSALLKDNPELQLGQRMPLLIEGRPVFLRIVGIVDSGAEALAYTSQSEPVAWRGGEFASILVIRASDRGQAGQLDLIHRLRTSLESQGVAVGASRLQSDSRQGIEDHLQMVVSFLGMMGWVMIVVGGMGLASTMSVAVLERQREIGVLRAIGASGAAIVSMVQLEGLVMALLGWLLSLPLSVPVSVLLGEAFGRVMFAIPTSLTPEPGVALCWLGLVTAVSVLACAWPARQAMRMPVVKALQYE
ncbi:FtsX-like permease family protein [Massilia sp. TWR1-2-2]|uniref:ABC transporter permease n=1 Tax=Massilia sp. TWR1-2-2 TaxID=2804584 RepID=UPI003CF934AC